MATIAFKLRTMARPDRVFDLSRSVELHLESTGPSREEAVGGVCSGLLGLHDEVEWEATHFGVRQRLRSRITAFDRPRHFQDSMVSGAFRRFDHDHYFETVEGGTLIRETFDFEAPWGPLGRIAEALVLERYLRRMLIERTKMIIAVAESNRWSDYVPTGREDS